MSEMVRDSVEPDACVIVTETRRSYEESADHYGRVTAGYATFPGVREEVMRFDGAARPGFPVLDLGSGAGRDSRLLAGGGRRVVAADLAVRLLRTSRTTCHDEGVAVPHVQLDMVRLPFADGVFGGTWASGSLLHLPVAMMESVLSEILRTLAAGGVAFISMRAGDTQGWQVGGSLPGRRWFSLLDPADFRAMMEKAGFQAVNANFVGRPGWFVAVGHRG